MAGSISLSLSQQFDSTGAPLNGGFLYTYAAGTTTPQSAYQDYSLTIPWPNPMVLDSAGRIPSFYLADGQIKIRLTDSAGVTQVSADNLLVVGASAGTGTPPTVDATTIFQTGDVMWLDVSGNRTGWVRDNGRTIGSATSGATERANADTSALYTFLYNTYSDTICPVATGRGANAAADYAANKAIGLPNKQGMIAGGLDGMGNTATGVWSTAPVISGSVTTAGSVVGAVTNTIASANLPAYTPSGTVTSTLGGSFTKGIFLNGGSTPPAVAIGGASSGGQAGDISVSSGFTGTAAAGQINTPMPNVQKTVLGTFYRKL